MKWYKRDPDAARLSLLQRRYGPNCCGEFPMYEHVRHFVYVIGQVGGPTKIGLCKNLYSRIRALQTASPFPIDLFWSASVPSREIAGEMERSVLRQFQRVNGEWLHADPLDVAMFLEA